MKYQLPTVLSLLLLFAGSFQMQAQTKGQKKYLSSYEGKNLTPPQTPVLLPYNRWIDPAGTQLFFGNKELENHAMDVALSPDEKWLAIEGRYEVVVVSVANNKIAGTFQLSNYFNKQLSMNSFSGICWRQEGSLSQLFWGAYSKEASGVVMATWGNGKFTDSDFIPFAKEAPAATSLANEVIYRNESGKPAIYVTLNGNNKVVKLDPDTRKVLWSTLVGVAPYGITKANGKIYVTNWAGGQPENNDKNVAGVPWGSAKVNTTNGATREGTVTVLNPATGAVLKEIPVGLHPNDVITGSDEKFVYVSNANSDEVSVISTADDLVKETISVRLNAEKNGYWGDSPNGLALSKDNKTLYVCNGMDNALAVITLGQTSTSGSAIKSSVIEGFIPTGAYPGAAVVMDNTLFVANIEAEGSGIPSFTEGSKKAKYNSHKEMASISIIPIPTKKELKAYTERVIVSNQHFRLDLTAKLPRKNTAPVPVPERIGEPSVFKHVLYIIKENRTYDQVLGDMKKGDGDSTLTVYGKKITPNTHQLSDQFVLLDNYHASGKCSAEGHQWTDASIVTDWVEKSVRAWFRSYPHVQYDALVYSPTGFIWDNALAHNKKVRIYGEACLAEFGPGQTWSSIYKGFLNHEKLSFTNKTTIQPVEAILSQDFPSSDNHLVSDVQRADIFIKELKALEQQEGDQLPELMVMALSNDHTSGTRPGMPTPRAFVADNDLAVAQIVEALSKSKFWKNTAVFVTEDDSQDGWDHVSAYRTVGMVISPFSKTATLVHTNYNQVSMVRTIEQILGIPPMNIMDATAMPMFDCFTTKQDLTPYKALKNEVPIDELNPDLRALSGKALRYARRSMEPQFDGIDDGDEDLFNQILWFAAKGNTKYPHIKK